MATFIALLRGINVGGNPLKMEKVRELWAKLGFGNVRTYVQSGNVVFESKDSPSKALAKIQRTLVGQTRLPVPVMLRTPVELKKVIARNPFLKRPGIDHSKLHVTFLETAGRKGAAKTLSAFDFGEDEFHCAGREVYLHCPNGCAESKLTNARLEKAFGVRATTRNWNTVNALDQMASG
jgi:uncharacterized protein (DUF1697 family)